MRCSRSRTSCPRRRAPALRRVPALQRLGARSAHRARAGRGRGLVHDPHEVGLPPPHARVESGRCEAVGCAGRAAGERRNHDLGRDSGTRRRRCPHQHGISHHTDHLEQHRLERSARRARRPKQRVACDGGRVPLRRAPSGRGLPRDDRRADRPGQHRDRARRARGRVPARAGGVPHDRRARALAKASASTPQAAVAA